MPRKLATCASKLNSAPTIWGCTLSARWAHAPVPVYPKIAATDPSARWKEVSYGVTSPCHLAMVLYKGKNMFLSQLCSYVVLLTRLFK